jgi:hypothetical protein
MKCSYDENLEKRKKWQHQQRERERESKPYEFEVSEQHHTASTEILFYILFIEL